MATSQLEQYYEIIQVFIEAINLEQESPDHVPIGLADYSELGPGTAQLVLGVHLPPVPVLRVHLLCGPISSRLTFGIDQQVSRLSGVPLSNSIIMYPVSDCLKFQDPIIYCSQLGQDLPAPFVQQGPGHQGAEKFVMGRDHFIQGFSKVDLLDEGVPPTLHHLKGDVICQLVNKVDHLTGY